MPLFFISGSLFLSIYIALGASQNLLEAGGMTSSCLTSGRVDTVRKQGKGAGDYWGAFAVVDHCPQAGCLHWVPDSHSPVGCMTLGELLNISRLLFPSVTCGWYWRLRHEVVLKINWASMWKMLTHGIWTIGKHPVNVNSLWCAVRPALATRSLQLSQPQCELVPSLGRARIAFPSFTTQERFVAITLTQNKC